MIRVGGWILPQIPSPTIRICNFKKIYSLGLDQWLEWEGGEFYGYHLNLCHLPSELATFKNYFTLGLDQ